METAACCVQHPLAGAALQVCLLPAGLHAGWHQTAAAAAAVPAAAALCGGVAVAAGGGAPRDSHE